MLFNLRWEFLQLYSWRKILQRNIWGFWCCIFTEEILFFFFAIFNFNVHVIILFAEILLIDVSWRKGKWKHLKYNDFYNISYPTFNRLLLVDIVKSLLAAGAQPDSRNSKTKRTCLHEVVSNRSKTLLDKSRFTIIQMLTWSCIK